jgi:hypothetical protein
MFIVSYGGKLEYIHSSFGSHVNAGNIGMKNEMSALTLGNISSNQEQCFDFFISG